MEDRDFFERVRKAFARRDELERKAGERLEVEAEALNLQQLVEITPKGEDVLPKLEERITEAELAEGSPLDDPVGNAGYRFGLISEEGKFTGNYYRYLLMRAVLTILEARGEVPVLDLLTYCVTPELAPLQAKFRRIVVFQLLRGRYIQPVQESPDWGLGKGSG